jgi:hypothetical protein
LEEETGYREMGQEATGKKEQKAGENMRHGKTGHRGLVNRTLRTGDGMTRAGRVGRMEKLN